MTFPHHPGPECSCGSCTKVAEEAVASVYHLVSAALTVGSVGLFLGLIWLLWRALAE